LIPASCHNFYREFDQGNQMQKACSKCGCVKPFIEFHKDANKKHGIRSRCKTCTNELTEQDKANSAKRQTKYRQQVRVQNRIVAYSQKNAPSIQNVSAACRAGKAAVAWANREACEKIYAQRIAITKWTGLPYNVDHVVPLKGVDQNGLHVVCGLHNEFNLKVITRLENRKKSNKFSEIV
jgi:hypothetical protein